MTDALFALVPAYGGWLLFGVTYLSCLALPMPSSLMMLGGGAFAASGDLSLATAGLAAYAGAIAGDQSGYLLGRLGGTSLVGRLRRRRGAERTISRADALVAARGGMAVFLSRWLFSPLGPYVNFIGGAAGLRWRIFTLGSLGGEAVWVLIYMGLGYFFAGQVGQIATAAANLSGLLAGTLVTLVLGALLFRRHA